MATEDWLITKGPDRNDWTSQSHPSFGVIGVSRVSGQASLFDSDVTHGHFIQITVSEAEKIRTGFTHEHVHGGKILLKVNLSFAQFAQMITTQNVGAGTPCTLQYVYGDTDEPWLNSYRCRPEPPMPPSFLDRFKGVGKERADRVLANVERALKQASDLLAGADKPTKANLKTIVDTLFSAKQDVEANLPYLMECLDEELEHKLANAVTEFESYVSSSLQEKGFEAMRAHQMTLNTGAQAALPESTAPPTK